MALFLVQHGLSLSKEIDPERGLSEEGISTTQRIAGVATHYDIPVKKICHSGKTRAAQTAAIFQEAINPEHAMETVVVGINPKDDVKSFSATIDSAANAMVVGHLPFMENLVSFLTTGSDDIFVYQFQNSGIVCLDQNEKGWFIKWTLNPDIS